MTAAVPAERRAQADLDTDESTPWMRMHDTISALLDTGIGYPAALGLLEGALAAAPADLLDHLTARLTATITERTAP